MLSERDCYLALYEKLFFYVPHYNKDLCGKIIQPIVLKTYQILKSKGLLWPPKSPQSSKSVKP